MRALMHRFAAFLGACLLAGALSAQTSDLESAPSANDLHEFTRLLADERIQDWIQQQAETAAEEDELLPEAQSVREVFHALLERTRDRLTALSLTFGAMEPSVQMVEERFQSQVPDNRRVQSLTFVMIFLFLGGGMEWLFRQYTNPLRKWLEVTRAKTPGKRIGAAFARAGLLLAGLFVFSVGSIGAFSAYEWPPILFSLILNLLIAFVTIRFVSTMMLLFFAPYSPQMRLVPVSTGLARIIGRTVLTFASVLIIVSAISDVFRQVATVLAPDAAQNAILFVSVVLSLGVALVALLCIQVGFFLAARQMQSPLSKPARRWRGFSSGLVLLLLALWILDLKLVMWSAGLIGTMILALKLLRDWVDHSLDQAAEEHRAHQPAPPIAIIDEGELAISELEQSDADPDLDPEADQEPSEFIDPYETYRPILQRLVRFGVIISVGFSLTLIWNLGIFEDTETPSVVQRLFSILLDSAAALLIADLLWTWARTTIDRRLNAYVPPEDGKAPGPEARMATLLPLLRVVLMVTLLTMVVMSTLSSMGVNIAPILAGASVLGIAIGFGAQSLVRDVVSGIFFLIDDAFRVGEYVEIDQLRGTVEQISIRSLQIRHHRGAVHTLPFGELKSMTNHSRDWVIMKLEFRVPFDTDLKLVKKLIKQVGAKLEENEEYGHRILQTLKSQGVRRMEEFNMVVGVKFMTRPGEQWLVRRDAYQMVRDIFEQNGIRMAERNVKVELEGDETLTPEQRKAVTAAAQEAVTNELPPGPIPDEP